MNQPLELTSAQLEKVGAVVAQRDGHRAALDVSDTGTGKTLCAVEVMKRLDPKRFIMCNRSYVVNLRYVSNINNDFLVVDGTQISISKSHRKEILQHFSNFLGENL